MNLYHLSRQQLWPWLAAVGVTLAVSLAVIGMRQSGYLQSLELFAYDAYVRLATRSGPRVARVVLITISEEDIQKLGRWPLSDATLARLLKAVVQARPRAIGLDLYRDIAVPPGHEALTAMLRDNPEIVAVTRFKSSTNVGVSSPAVLAGTDRVGFNDVVPDPGGLVRRGLLFLDDGQTLAYSLALRLALLYLKPENVQPHPDPTDPAHIRLGETTISPFESSDGSYVNADAGGYQFLLDFADAARGFESYSLADVLAGTIEPSVFAEKIILIGSTAESVPDVFYTPHSRRLVASQQMWGVELHAHIANQLLRIALEDEQPMATAADGQEALWIVLWCVLGSVVGLRAGAALRFAGILMSGLVVIGGVTYALFTTGIWIPVIPPAIVWILCASLVTAYVANSERQQRRTLMNLFSRHVSRDLASEIWRRRDEFLDGERPRSQRLTATVMFTDLHQFTRVSEKLDPQTLMDWLNEYMACMTPHVIEKNGVILRFIGDAILAVFGIPIARSTDAEIRRDAQHAVECAIEMQRELIDLNRELKERNMPMMGMRIGIYTGRMVGGSMGTSERLEYNVHGDTVNTAARLENVNKQSFEPDFLRRPCRIYVGDTTKTLVEETGFNMRSVGRLELRGKEQAVCAYEVIDPGEQES